MKRFLLSVLLLAVLLMGGPRFLELILGSAPAESEVINELPVGTPSADIINAPDTVSLLSPSDTIACDTVVTKHSDL